MPKKVQHFKILRKQNSSMSDQEICFSSEIVCSPGKFLTIYLSWASIFQQNSLIHHCYANDTLLYLSLPSDSPGETLIFQAHMEDIKFDITKFLSPRKYQNGGYALTLTIHTGILDTLNLKESQKVECQIFI